MQNKVEREKKHEEEEEDYCLTAVQVHDFDLLFW